MVATIMFMEPLCVSKERSTLVLDATDRLTNMPNIFADNENNQK